MQRQQFLGASVGAAALTVLPRTGSAQTKTYYGLIVNGSPRLLISYDDNNILFVRGLRPALKAAGSTADYVRNLPPGTASWPDRPMRSGEPLTIKQQMPPDQARAAIARLHQNGGFWEFYCWNTGAGYFEVQRSNAVYASVRID